MATQAAACAPSGTIVKVTALNKAFDSGCLAAPAGSAFSLTMVNQDPGIPHNVAIYTDASASTNLFRGEVVSGPTTATYKVLALKVGTYYFRCDIHPQMSGTFVVR